MSFSRLTRALLFLALVKVGGGLWVGVVTLTRIDDPFSNRIPIFLAFVCCHALVAALLLVGRGERAADLLGAILLLTATPYAGATIRRAAEVFEIAPHAIFFHYLQFDAFTPLFLWLFAGVFPNDTPEGRPQRILRYSSLASLVAAVALFVLNLVMFAGRYWPPLSEQGTLGLLRARSENSYFWVIAFSLDIGALAFALWKARRAHVLERRRVQLFVGGIVFGNAPLIVLTIGQYIFPAINEWLAHPKNEYITLLMLDVTKITIPITAAYAVLVERVVDYQLILRKAVRYALGRYTIVALAGVPLILFAAFLFEHRDESLARLLTGRPALIALPLAAASLLVLRYRGRWLDWLDRRFFRERYDAQHILASLIEQVSEVSDGVRLCGVIEEEMARALHVRSPTVYVLEPSTGVLVDPRQRSGLELPGEGDIGKLLSRTGSPLEIEIASIAQYAELSEGTREWILEAGFRVFAPMLSGEKTLLGIIALGEKESELPFSDGDRKLISAMASSAAIAVERQLLRSSVARLHSTSDSTVSPTSGEEAAAPGHLGAWRAPMSEERAFECVACARIGSGKGTTCTSCGAMVTPIGLPLVLLGKFRLLERVGRGGMGVVYRAEDLQLGRQVAVKTLPRMSARQSERLRREARAIAAVEHPNLAIIYAVENLQSLPLLIFEYLGGGTLADRIRRGRLPAAETLRIGVEIAGVVERVHGAGILHRDIKPSNIGFSEKGAPKLLDFGLAKLLLSTQKASGAPLHRLEEISPETTSIALSRRGRTIVGTPMYLSPEALQGAKPDPSFDVWSLCVVLYETLTGHHPFRAASTEQTLAKILTCSFRGLGEALPGCSGDLSGFFDSAFARKRSRRLQGIHELLDLLEALDRAAA